MKLPDEYVEGLRSATQNMSGWKKRWAYIVANGATDEQILNILRFQWTSGGYHGSGICSIHKGGSSPEITMYKGYNENLDMIEPIRLHGKALVSHIRAIYNIPPQNQRPLL